MARPPLEAQLAAVTQEFVGRLVEVIRNASFAEVAALSVPGGKPATAAGGALKAKRRRAAPAHRGNHTEAKEATRVRQTAAHRAELAERVMQALKEAQAPLGVRAISSGLGVAPDLLAAPLRELRAAGRITKHGEKRATTYSAG
jgi:hypothetical protein